jgi:hypothetical protein
VRRTRSSQTTGSGASPPPSPLKHNNSRANGRRSYDRSLATPGGQQQTSYHQPHAHAHPTAYSHYATANEARRRSANYAWERRRRPPPPGSNPHLHFHRPHPRSQPSPSSPSSATNEHPQFRQATASTRHYRPPRADWKETELDRVNRVSGLGRAMQLVGLFSIAIALVGAMGKS